jgi:hypothetical protein
LQLGALERAPQPEFLTCGLLFSREVQEFRPPIRLIVLRNVFHEIPLSELPHTLFHLTRIADVGTVIIVQDMIRLKEGELGAVTWDPDDLFRLFPSPKFSVADYPDVSRGGTPWMTVTVEVRRSSSDAEHEWNERCRNVARYKHKKIKLALQLYKAEPPEGRTGYEYVHLAHMFTMLSLELEGKPEPDLDTERETRGIVLGSVCFPVVVIEGGIGSIGAPLRIEFEAAKDPYIPPIELKEARPTLLAAALNRAQLQGATLYDGLHYGLRDYSLRITNPESEERQLVLSVQPTTYFDHITSNMVVDEPILRVSGRLQSLRNFYQLNAGRFRDSVLANQLGVNISVITRVDNSLIYALRGEKTFTFSAGFVTAINASMTRGMDEAENGKPDPLKTVLREAMEELGIDVDRQSIELVALVQDLKHLQPLLIGLAFVDQSAEDIMRLAAIRARDRFEYKGLLSMPFEPSIVARHIISHHDQWVPQCAVSVIYALMRVFGHDEAMRAFEGKAIYGFIATSGGHYVPAVRQNIREFVSRSFRHFRPKGPVLDIGSGYRSARWEILSVDPTLDVKTADLNAAFQPDYIVDAADMVGIPEDSFGCVVCTELLEHIQSPEKVIHEIYRVLRPGGLVIFTVPFAVVIHERPDQPDYWRFTPRALRYLLEKFFRDVSVEVFGDKIAPLNVMATAHK